MTRMSTVLKGLILSSLLSFSVMPAKADQICHDLAQQRDDALMHFNYWNGWLSACSTNVKNTTPWWDTWGYWARYQTECVTPWNNEYSTHLMNWSNEVNNLNNRIANECTRDAKLWRGMFPEYSNDADVYAKLQQKAVDLGACADATTNVRNSGNVYTNVKRTCRATLPDIRKSEVRVEGGETPQEYLQANAAQIRDYLQKTLSVMDKLNEMQVEWNKNEPQTHYEYGTKSKCFFSIGPVCIDKRTVTDYSNVIRSYEVNYYPNRTNWNASTYKFLVQQSMIDNGLVTGNYTLINNPGSLSLFTVVKNDLVQYVNDLTYVGGQYDGWSVNPVGTRPYDSNFFGTGVVEFTPNERELCPQGGVPVGIGMGQGYNFSFGLGWLRNSTSLSDNVISQATQIPNGRAMVEAFACAPIKEFKFERK